MEPLRPDWDGASLPGIVPALLDHLHNGAALPAWMPDVVAGASAVVLLVLDGLGWTAIQDHRARLPVLGALSGGPATSVVPSTTGAALTSIATGMPPARHGIVGYRMVVGGSVLDVLQWRVPEGKPPTPDSVTSVQAFGGRPVPVVTRAEFARSGFTAGQPAGRRLRGLAHQRHPGHPPGAAWWPRRAPRLRLLRRRRQGRPRVRPGGRLLSRPSWPPPTAWSATCSTSCPPRRPW